MAKNSTTSLKKSRGKYELLGSMRSGGGSMTYRDIKRQAIILGMPFPDGTVLVLCLISLTAQVINPILLSSISTMNGWTSNFQKEDMRRMTH